MTRLPDVYLTYHEALARFGRDSFSRILQHLSEQPAHHMTSFKVGMQMFYLTEVK